jgi:hypothetical protein
MYYMELQKTFKPHWTPLALLGMLRASLPAAPREAATTVPGVLEPAADAPPGRLGSHEYLEVANAWRSRTSFGDLGAESVAQALELVATHRSTQKQSRLQAVSRKLAELRRAGR